MGRAIQAKRETSAVTLGAQIGGTDAHEKTHASIVDLRKLLAEFCVGPYSDAIDEFAPIARVDGAIQQFGIHGIANLRRSSKGRYITADLGINVADWQGSTEREFRDVLFTLVNDAIEVFLTRLAKDKVYVDSSGLRNDIEEVKRAYLSSPDS